MNIRDECADRHLERVFILRVPNKSACLFVVIQNTFKINVFVPNLVKNVSSKKNIKDHDFCLFLIFFVLFCCFCRI